MVEAQIEVQVVGVLWVDATPFRAHLTHVMAVGDMDVDVVAAMAGVSVRALRHLLSGRDGRPVRRISAETGRRLLRITSFDARTVRQRVVSARATTLQIREIRATGMALAEVAARSGIDVDLIAELTEGFRKVCSPLLAAKVTALHTALDVGTGLGIAVGTDSDAAWGYPLAS